MLLIKVRTSSAHKIPGRFALFNRCHICHKMVLLFYKDAAKAVFCKLILNIGLLLS